MTAQVSNRQVPIKRKLDEINFQVMPMGRWKVVWLGDVNFHARHTTSSQPTIAVQLECLDEESPGKQLEVSVPIAQLFALKLHRIWQDRVCTDEYDSRIIQKEIRFRGADAVECMAGVPMVDLMSTQYLLPFDQHPHHKAHTKSWCVKVEIDSEIFIFPSSELIRFYFGSTGSLLKKIFSENFSLQSLAIKAELDDRKHAFLELPSEIAAVAAPHVARIAFDRNALQAAAAVSRSLVAASCSGLEAKLYPRTVFPFRGETRMQIKGYYLNTADKLKRFLVTEISTCGYPFPFAKLQYVSASKKRPDPCPEQSEGSLFFKALREMGIPFSGGLKNDEPSKSKATKPAYWSKESQFPDLLKKRVDKVSPPTPTQVMLSSYPASPFESTGDGRSSSKGRKVDPVALTDERWRLRTLYCPDPRWKPYFSFLQELADQEWIGAFDFVRLDPRQKYPYFSEVPELIDQDGLIVEATLRTSSGDESHLVPRLASFVNLNSNKGVGCLISMCPLHEEKEIVVFVWWGQKIDPLTAISTLAAAQDGATGTPHLTLTLSVDAANNGLQPTQALLRLRDFG